MPHRRLIATLGIVWLALSVSHVSRAAGSPTLDIVRARGQVICAMQGDNVPFSILDRQSVWHGVDVDSCRALAAAIFGDPDKFSVRVITGMTRFTTLQSGEADILFGSTTWTTTRETANGLVFAGANYYSGQGFLVHTASGVHHTKDLDGATICVPPGSSSELLLQDYFEKIGATFRPVVIDDPSQIANSFLSGRCDAYTRDLTGLAGFRSRQSDPASLTLLPEIISMEPLGPFVRKGDDGWLDIVRWTQFALIAAEQLGIKADTVQSFSATKDPDIQRLLGQGGNIGASMSLDPQWAARAIAAVGSYGEIWTRNVASMDVPRGLNRLWNQGGIMFAPPLR